MKKSTLNSNVALADAQVRTGLTGDVDIFTTWFKDDIKEGKSVDLLLFLDGEDVTEFPEMEITGIF